MIVYFSGTGNSRYVAQRVAAATDDTLVDVAPLIREKRSAVLCSQRPWVFIAPTYAWQLPRIFTNFLRSSRLSGARQAYFLMTCGNSIGAAAFCNRRLCADLNLAYAGTGALVMPENYIAMFNTPGPAEAREIRDRVKPKLDALIAKIRAGRPLPTESVRLIARLLTGPGNALFYSKVVKAEPFFSTDSCTGCSLCQSLCPLDNIRLEAGRPVWGRNCTHCMACICSCPAEAIEYGRRSQGKPRYLCPEYGEKHL